MKMKKNTFCVGKMNSLQYYCPIKSEPITECINSILLTNAVADLYLTKCSPKYMLGEYKKVIFYSFFHINLY